MTLAVSRATTATMRPDVRSDVMAVVVSVVRTRAGLESA
jgi:hypothetical protein